MRVTRLYLDSPLSENQTLCLDGEHLNYIANVLRLKAGTLLSVFNGQGGEYSATLTTISKRNAELHIGHFTNTSYESPLHITLAQCVSRGERMDFTLQKATELGVSRIIPVFSERCTVSLKGDRLEKRLHHWQGIIRSACEQSGRNTLPELLSATDFSPFVQQETSPHKIILDPTSPHKLDSLAMLTHITLLVGPEGGFSDREREQAYTTGFKGIQLGPRILRTETAAIACIGALQTLQGDFL